MSWLIIEALNLQIMIEFYRHSAFEKETAKLQKRFSHLEKGLHQFQRLCEEQFHPTNPHSIIAPGKIHRVTANEIWTIWKVELVVKNLRPNQFPRVWFAVEGSKIAFLCIGTHIDNYDNNTMDRIAISRVTDIF